jgi:hypothetical protein
LIAFGGFHGTNPHVKLPNILVLNQLSGIAFHDKTAVFKDETEI